MYAIPCLSQSDLNTLQKIDSLSELVETTLASQTENKNGDDKKKNDWSIFLFRWNFFYDLFSVLFWNKYYFCMNRLVTCKPRLHHSESSKDQIIHINLPRAAKVCFISMWKFCCSMEGTLERQYLFKVELLQHFLQLRKLSRAARKAFVDRGPYVVQTWCKAFDSSRLSMCLKLLDNIPSFPVTLVSVCTKLKHAVCRQWITQLPRGQKRDNQRRY